MYYLHLATTLNLQSAKPSSAVVCGMERLCLFYVIDIHDGCVKQYFCSCMLGSNLIILRLSCYIYIEMYYELCGNWKFLSSFISLKKQSCHLMYISVLCFPWFSKWKIGWRYCTVELPSISSTEHCASGPLSSWLLQCKSRCVRHWFAVGLNWRPASSLVKFTN